MIDFFAEEAKALPGAFSAYDMEAIYPALKAMEKGDIYLEIGVKNGRSLKFARDHSKGDIYGIDINNEVHPIKNVNFIQIDSLKAYKDWTLPIKVLFIDGNHDYEVVKSDFKNFSPFVVKGGQIFFHDCDKTSPGVVKVYKQIKWPKVLCRDEMADRNTSMARVTKP